MERERKEREGKEEEGEGKTGERGKCVPPPLQSYFDHCFRLPQTKLLEVFSIL